VHWKTDATMPDSTVIAALYKFHPIADPESVREALETSMDAVDVRGTILVAEEGLNGTIAGSRSGVDTVLATIRALKGFDDLLHKESFASEVPFLRAKVRLKKEIVTLGVDGVDPNRIVGTYVSPKDWNRLISRPDVVLVDTRNAYEVEVGTFRGAINPNTGSFRDFPDFVASELADRKEQPIAMFCTGGIRCEKATSYLREQGFKEVYHLEGGILKYLEDVAPANTMWDGECFVFDGRVTVDHGLQPGTYAMCHACRMPVTASDMELDSWEEGVSCLYCAESRSEEDRERLRERQHQLQLAASRGLPHLGQDARDLMISRQAATS